ncbi:DUF6993 domain-containing protein [Arthrobacter sp. RHLT1-20]
MDSTAGFRARATPPVPPAGGILRSYSDRACVNGRLLGAYRRRKRKPHPGFSGFSADAVEATASRTPTGLDTDADEVAVKAGRNCIVAQVRTGSVRAVILRCRRTAGASWAQRGPTECELSRLSH